MSHESNLLPLTCTSASLCFDIDKFMKDDFEVDLFVTECRHKVQLETLREDLHSYLKKLKSSMIELINKDYTDFVNLSSNLVGMDKAINNLTSPLEQLKEQIMLVRSSIMEAMNETQGKIKLKNKIARQKACLQQLTNIINSVDKIEVLLRIGNEEDPNCSCQLDGQLLERVATEFNKLQFYVSKNRNLPLIQEIKPRIANITTTLQYSLEGSFKDGLEHGQLDTLRQCLRTYATIDKIRDAENLFRQYAVSPYMAEIISEEVIQSNQEGLRGMYKLILNFIPMHCKSLKEVTSGSFSSTAEVVRGYDFIVNSVWPEVIHHIETRTPSIFAPGNPDIFHDRYTTSMEFVKSFEKLCSSQSSVKCLRNDPSYSTFMSKWSLPVYYQIRFQEIAGNLEMAFLSPFAKGAGNIFHLQATTVLWASIHLCWADHIYLRPLCHRFWKLTLQILARYTSWLKDLYSNELSKIDSSIKDTKDGKPTELDNRSFNGELAKSVNSQKTYATTQQVVMLVTDAENISTKLIEFFREVVHKRLIALGVADVGDFEGNINDVRCSIQDQLNQFDDYIVREISSLCSFQLKLVNDIPRLYRRTNREIPNKASTYVCNVFKPLKAFLEEHKEITNDVRRKIWISQVLQNLTSQYHVITNDVLTSVKKMEDSLKRLKKARGSITSLSQGMSDDDKIRRQITIDIKHYGDQIESMNIVKTDVEAYLTLSGLVDVSQGLQVNNTENTSIDLSEVT